MERTKLLNQNKKQQKPLLLSSVMSEIALGLKPFAHYSFRKFNIRETLTQNYLFFPHFFQEKIHKERK